MIHLTNKRFHDRQSRIIEVKVYCNAGPVELKVNGGKILMASRGYEIYTARVVLKPGRNSVTASAQAPDGKTLTDSCEWNFAAR